MRLPLAVIALILCLVSSSDALAGLRIFAKFETGSGDWAGSSLVDKRQGWAELESFGFAATNTFVIGSSGSGASTGKANFEQAQFLKAVDQLTPQIFAALTQGRTLNDLVIEFVTDNTLRPQVVFRAEFKLVGFTLLSTESATGEDRLLERVAMEYGAIRLTTWTPTNDGTQGTAVIRSWNRVTNTADFRF